MRKNSQIVPIEYAISESFRLLHKIKQEIEVILIDNGRSKLLSNSYNKVIDAINEIENNIVILFYLTKLFVMKVIQTLLWKRLIVIAWYFCLVIIV